MSWSNGDRLVVLIGAGAPILLLIGLGRSLDHRQSPAAAPLPLIVAAPEPAPTPEPQPDADVACSLSPAHASPVGLTCQVAREPDRNGVPTWRLDVQIVNHTDGLVAGTIWVVASIRAEDGHVERVASPAPLPFKAHSFTRKSFRLALPEAARGTLTGLEAFVASGKGVVSFANEAH